MQSLTLKDIILYSLDEIKAIDSVVMDVKKLGVFSDYIMISTGTSRRHIKAISSSVIQTLKENNLSNIGIEGQDQDDWVLVDAGDIIINVMTEEARDFYDLEGLWDVE